MNVTHPLGMLIFTHSLFLYPKPFLFSTVACNATPARSGVTYGILACARLSDSTVGTY